MSFFDKLIASALSIVVSGNTGVTPFLTLLLVGSIEKFNPDLLEMEETMEKLLASWPALVFLFIMTTLEFVSKCVPVVDEVVDSAMTVIVPVISIFGSLSTFGLFEQEDDDGRRLSLGSSSLLLFQIFLVICGIVFALCMHFFKMLIRLIGEGWLTGIITIMEISWVLTTVTICIFIKPIAIFVAAVIVCICIYNIKRKYFDDEEEPPPIQGMPAVQNTTAPTKVDTYVKMEEGTDDLSPVSTARSNAPMDD